MKRLVGIAVAVSALNGFAATNINATTSSSSFLDDLAERTSISYWGEVYGPSVDNVSGNVVDGAGNEELYELELWHQIGTKIKLNDSQNVGFAFSGTQLLNPRADKDGNTADNFTFEDPEIYFSTSVFKAGPVSAGNKTSAFIPVSDASNRNGLTSYFKNTFTTTYSPTAGLNIYLPLQARFYSYDGTKGEARTDSSFRYYPGISYSINDTVTVKAEYWGYSFNKASGSKERGNVFDLTNRQNASDRVYIGTDIALGSVTLMPWVGLRPGDAYRSRSTTLNLYFSASLF